MDLFKIKMLLLMFGELAHTLLLKSRETVSQN